MYVKICKKCKIEKDINLFFKNKSSKDGFRSECKECNKKYQLNKEYQKEYQQLYREKNKSKKKEYNKTYMKSYYVKNKSVIKDYVKSHNVKTNYYNNYRKNKYKNDIIYRSKCLLRSMIYDAFDNQGFVKTKKTSDILGCSIQEYITYIEQQFEPWMSWDNQGNYTGNYNETWQLDHIIPISNATTEEEVIKLNHYTNLRPLCSRKNVEKSNK